MAPGSLIFASVLSLSSIDKHSLSTDELAELSNGTPPRFLLLWDWKVEATLKNTKKFWIEKTDWASWTYIFEGRIDDLMVVMDDPVSLCNEFKNLIMKLPLFTNPSNVFQIIANRFGTHIWQKRAKSFNFYENCSSTSQNLRTDKSRSQRRNDWKFYLTKCIWTDGDYLSSLGHKRGREFKIVLDKHLNRW